MDTDEVIRRLKAEATRRLAKAAAYFAGQCKKVVSVPAPRRISRRGRPYATKRAVAGAPPRKLTGRSRAGIAWKVEPDGLSAIVGVSVFYMGLHERKNHPWVAPTLAAEMVNVRKILAGGSP